ncbi:Heterokaryon incompatibility protein 6, OR allele [Pseudocercospora fuligena]|uniref:Heterokaryon incompatibility protein 6, OR allele n=1 Tax=Pseudocercospora fuligena TaxID=685502 RepID=A0A8H6VQV4_9PEZI|nr:Heterokaryon incompatibility protein 6, OR allele [Pseudocercospora fuligena]
MSAAFNYDEFSTLKRRSSGDTNNERLSPNIAMHSGRTRSRSAARRKQAYLSDAFRILKLLPGSRNSDLQGTLLVRRLKNKSSTKFQPPEDYEALSYNWGPKSPEKSIRLLAENTEYYTMSIGPNLDAALRHLRSTDRATYLWVDALCINQQDQEEKGVQIPLMRDIYNNARCVRVWLGVEGDDSSRAMDFILECLDLDNFDKLVTDAIASPRWAALSALIRRPWFNRRWIIQEIALAREATVHCGEKIISWDDFASVTRMLSEAQPQLRKLFRESTSYKNHPDFLGDLSELGAIKLADLAENLLNKLDDDGSITGKKLPLEALVSSLTGFEAGLDHDVIYAILWLANDAHPVTKSSQVENIARPPLRHWDSNSPLVSPVSSIGPDLPSPRRTEPEGREKFPPYEELTFSAPNVPWMPVFKKRKRSQSDPGGTIAAAKQRSIYEAQSSNRDRRHLQRIATQQSDASAPETAERKGHDRPHPKIQISTEPERINIPNTSTPTRERPGHNRHRLSISDASIDEKEQVAAMMFKRALERGRIIVDYEKPIFEVYQDFVELALRHTNSLDILCLPWAPAHPSLPSWIPQLSRNPFGSTNSGIHRRINADPLVKRPGHAINTSKPYRASLSLLAQWNMGGEERKSLFVGGFILDTVEHREKPAVDGTIPAKWMAAGGWKDPDEKPPDVFWRTLVGNLNPEGTDSAPKNWQLSCRDAFKRRPKGGPLNTTTVLFDCPENVRKFLERAQRIVWSRRLVQLKGTCKRSIALAPGKTKKGDLVCILYGCSVPVVLRKMIDNEPAASRFRCQEEGCPSKLRQESPPNVKVHYALIGECYVHGMMGGEALKFKPMTKDKKEINQMFELR